MTDEEKRIEIAELCGWTAKQDAEGFWRAVHPDGYMTHELWVSENNVWTTGIPDYLNDLNAMHAAEKTLAVTCDETGDGCECYRYIRLLHEVIGGVPNCFAHHCATAEQRATAFLLTKGMTP